MKFPFIAWHLLSLSYENIIPSLHFILHTNRADTTHLCLPKQSKHLSSPLIHKCWASLSSCCRLHSILHPYASDCYLFLPISNLKHHQIPVTLRCTQVWGCKPATSLNPLQLKFHAPPPSRVKPGTCYLLYCLTSSVSSFFAIYSIFSSSYSI